MAAPPPRSPRAAITACRPSGCQACRGDRGRARADGARPGALRVARRGPVRVAAAHVLLVLLVFVAPAPGQEAERFPTGPPVPTGLRGAERFPVTPLDATLLLRDDVEASPALGLDGVLRELPGVSLLGEAPSLAADPPTQALSLRAAGPGGPGRALVLVDGIPLNDPFGGWVPWGRIPLAGIERVEVVPGASPTVWGTSTTGGLVHVVTRAPGVRSAGLAAGYGEHGTAAVSLFATERLGRWGALVELDLLETKGTPAVRRDQRGAVDVDADAGHRTFTQKLEYQLGPDTSAFLTGRYFLDDRGLGTPLGASTTEAGGAAVGLRAGSLSAGQWDGTLFAGRQSFGTTVSSATRERSAERPALIQDIPADSLGAALQWTRRFLRRDGLPGPHLFTAGVDARRVEGESREESLDAAGVRRIRRAGGRQVQVGLFAQDIDTISPGLEVMMGARGEYVRSADGSVETTGAGEDRRLKVADQEAVHLSIRTAVRYLVTDTVALRASVTEGFRPPTLYERYSTARVRDDVTVATPRLDPERVQTGELGVEHRAAGVTLRATGFWTEVTDAIGAVTLPPDQAVEDCPAGATCRRRLNLDRARIVGAEVEGEYLVAPSWRVRGGYLHQESRVVRASVRPSLEGKRLAGVPRHQVTAGLRHHRPGWPRLSLQLRYVGPRFEDDVNGVRLARAVVLDLAASAPLGRWGELFLAVENVLDAVTEVGKTSDGVVTVGPPRLIRAGLRLRF